MKPNCLYSTFCGEICHLDMHREQCNVVVIIKYEIKSMASFGHNTSTLISYMHFGYSRTGNVNNMNISSISSILVLLNKQHHHS